MKNLIEKVKKELEDEKELKEKIEIRSMLNLVKDKEDEVKGYEERIKELQKDLKEIEKELADGDFGRLNKTLSFTFSDGDSTSNVNVGRWLPFG